MARLKVAQKLAVEDDHTQMTQDRNHRSVDLQLGGAHGWEATQDGLQREFLWDCCHW